MLSQYRELTGLGDARRASERADDRCRRRRQGHQIKP